MGMQVPHCICIEVIGDRRSTNNSVWMRVECLLGKSHLHAILCPLCSKLHFHGTQIRHHGLNIFASCFLVLLGVDCLEELGQQFHLGNEAWPRDHIVIKMDGTPLVFDSGNTFLIASGILPGTYLQRWVSSSKTQLYSHRKKADPTGFILLHSLGNTYDLSVSILVYCDRHQNDHIFKLSTPISSQIDPIHIDVWIVPALQRSVALLPSIWPHTLPCFARWWWRERHLAATKSLGNYPPYTGQRRLPGTSR